jgi:hypothetical protein
MGAEVTVPRLMWQTRDGTAVQQSDLYCSAKAMRLVQSAGL